MLRLILRDLRNMLRRPVVSLLLLIGLIVGGFAMVVYFVSSSQELKIQRYISGEENIGGGADACAPGWCSSFTTPWSAANCRRSTMRPCSAIKIPTTTLSAYTGTLKG